MREYKDWRKANQREVGEEELDGYKARVQGSKMGGE